MDRSCDQGLVIRPRASWPWAAFPATGKLRQGAEQPAHDVEGPNHDPSPLLLLATKHAGRDNRQEDTSPTLLMAGFKASRPL